MNEWWTDESRYEHVGYVEFGYNSIHEFEVYKDKVTGKYVTCYHDDPDQPGTIEELNEFAKEYTDPKYLPQLNEYIQLKKKLGI